MAFGGVFDLFGDVPCSGFATWNPATGAVASVPPPLPSVYAMAIAPNGDLVASIAGAGVGRIARLGASGWTILPGSFEGPVRGIAILPNGEIVITGILVLSGGTNLGAAARWSGTAWVPLGTGVPGEGVALATMPNGDVVVAANDAGANPPTSTINRWNGTTLIPLPSLGTFGLGQLTVGANGTLFTVAANSLWSFNGTAWTSHALPPWWVTVAITGVLGCFANGDPVLIVSTQPSAGSNDALRFAPATATWTQLPGSFGFQVESLAGVPGGAMFAVGQFDNIDSRAVANVAQWDGFAWQPLFVGAPGGTYAVESLTNDQFAIGGVFTSCGVVAAEHVAQWTGANWAAMGAGLNHRVYDLARLPNGDLLAGGEFTASGTVTARALARWDGTAWSEFAGGLGGLPRVRSIAVAPNGDVIVGGSFALAGNVPVNNVARWNGTAWSALGPGLGMDVQRVDVAPNGDVWALANYSSVLRWNGSTWTTMASTAGLAQLHDLEILSSGRVLVGGAEFWGLTLLPRAYLMHFDPILGLSGFLSGSEGNISHIVETPSGDALLFGQFAQLGGVSVTNAARLPVGATNVVPFAPGAVVNDSSFAPDGTLLVVGWFYGGQYAVGRLATTCPASATASGNGCVGSGGLNELTVAALPWLGSTFRSVATGMANGLAVGVYGLGTIALPLPTILPQGVAGCSLQVTPDMLLAYVPSSGSVQAALAIPDQPVFLGQTLRQQFVSLAITGSITAATSTNALTLTIGDF